MRIEMILSISNIIKTDICNFRYPFFKNLSKYKYVGDYTVEATALKKTGEIDIEMLNTCFHKLRSLISKYM